MTNCYVESLEQLPPVRAILLDVTPQQLICMAGAKLPGSTGEASNISSMAQAFISWIGLCTSPSHGGS